MGPIRRNILVIWMVLITGLSISSYNQKYRFRNCIREVLPSVVYVNTEDGSGSGVIVHERGLILTARHVIENNTEIEVTLTDGTIYPAIVYYEDPNYDVAILQIFTIRDLPTVPFGSTNGELGEEVFIVGSPFGIMCFNSVNKGIISGFNRETDLWKENLTQLDIASNPGNSGCPVFNMRSEIIGIVVGGIGRADGITYVIPLDICRKVVENYVKRD